MQCKFHTCGCNNFYYYNSQSLPKQVMKDAWYLSIDKYKDHLERVRRDRSQQSSPSNLSNGFVNIDQSQPSSYDQSEPIAHDQTWPRTRDQSRPSNSATFQNGTSWNHLPVSSSSHLDKYASQSTYQEDVPKAGYFEGPAKGLDHDVPVRTRPDLVPSASE